MTEPTADMETAVKDSQALLAEVYDLVGDHTEAQFGTGQSVRPMTGDIGDSGSILPAPGSRTQQLADTWADVTQEDEERLLSNHLDHYLQKVKKDLRRGYHPNSQHRVKPRRLSRPVSSQPHGNLAANGDGQQPILQVTPGNS